MKYTNFEKVLKRTFVCPMCGKKVERINDFLSKESIKEQLEIGLSNKRYHFIQHREEKRKLEKAKRLGMKFGRHSG